MRWYVMAYPVMAVAIFVGSGSDVAFLAWFTLLWSIPVAYVFAVLVNRPPTHRIRIERIE